MDKIINSFKVKKDLNSTFWIIGDNETSDDTKLDSNIRTTIMGIVKTFVDTLKIKEFEIEDILLMGSIAGFNWSSFSDVDIHILTDKSKMEGSDEMIEEFFNAKKSIFNDNHDITIKGFEFEIYVQDINEENASNGIFSVLYNKWLKFPEADDDKIEVDKSAIKKKVSGYNKEFNSLKSFENNDKKIKKIEALIDKIKKYRKAGLNKNGEMSTENLVFKYLRRSGYMEELLALKTNTIDITLTLKEGIVF